MDAAKLAQVRLRNLDHFEACGANSSDPAQKDIRDLLQHIDELVAERHRETLRRNGYAVDRQ